VIAVGSHNFQNPEVSDSGRKTCQSWLPKNLRQASCALSTNPVIKNNKIRPPKNTKVAAATKDMKLQLLINARLLKAYNCAGFEDAS
jgi:hypothetical protein